MNVELATQSVIQDAITSLLTNFGARAAGVGAEQLKQWIKSLRDSGAPITADDITDVDGLVDAVLQRAESKQGQHQYNAESLARWLEIPEPDLASVTPENFEPQVLMQHILLEHRFQTWFSQWGYQVELGEILRPADAPELECAVDVYGQLQTIHGTFEVAVNFVCDNPPDEDRVISLGSKMGAYADSRKTFAQNDVFMVVTPWDFTPIAKAALRHQNRKRSYCVLTVDGSILHDLESAEDPHGRLIELQERVTQANQEAAVGKPSN
jgi:hypothetical protein